MNSIDIINILCNIPLSVSNEKETQLEIEKIFHHNSIIHIREFKFDNKNIVDFLVDSKIAVEVKIKGNARKIYKQCERYCQFENVKEILIITNRSMGFPKEIDGKPCYILNIGKAWL